jgi:Tol biopolymer transport system component
MKSKRVMIFLLLLLIGNGLAACSPGHVGGNEIAFVRDGHIWTIDPDGSNAYEIVSQSTPVVGYSWSPNHELLTFRTLDADFARTTAAKHLSSNPITQLLGDMPTTLNTVGIDGGSPISIIHSDPSIAYSNAWWDADGNRLLYREASISPPPDPDTVLWWVSQSDQPGGIARKLLPASFSIPSIENNAQMAIGNSPRGLFTTTLAGTNLRYITQGLLPGHPLPAMLERVLWQPAHQNPAILYAIVPPTQAFNAPPNTVQLLLRASDGHTTTLTTCTCTQFAWSPDGKHILYSTGSTYSVLNPDGSLLYSFSAEIGSVPYWSPDGQFLLLDGLHTLLLVKPSSKQADVLLSDGSSPASTTNATAGASTTGSVDALLQPASNSPWAADSRHFLFLTRGRLLWEGKTLSSGKGLYTLGIDDRGNAQGAPAVVDTGNDIQAGWTYENPNTSFLF